MEYYVLNINPNKKALDLENNELKLKGINVVGATNYTDACTLMIENGSIHAILTELELPLDKKTDKKIKGADIFRGFAKIRYEVNVFIYTNKYSFDKYKLGGNVSGYFFKQDKDFGDIARKVDAEIRTGKAKAPFYDALVEYAQSSKDSWHTPGHSSGYSVKDSSWVKDFYDFFGENMFVSDLSVSVPSLDSLLHSEGVIKEAQDLAASAYGSRYSYFCTNGTSTANKILLQTLLKPGDAILLDRNCHKSVHYGIIISGAEPIYLMPSVNQKYGLFGPISKKNIVEGMDKAISAGKNLKVIIITSCTYDGLIYDVPFVVEEAHKRNIKVLVDEAWFGHSSFHRDFYPCAVRSGADYATQSTHKTMSAFSQGSMIHINDPEFEEKKDFFMENFSMHTSTSPQYGIIASLDIARKQMAMEGYSLLQRALDLSDIFRASAKSLKKFKVLELEDLISNELKNDHVRLDRTKLTVDISGSGYTGKELESILLHKYNIQVEKTTFNTISMLITIGSTYSKLNRLYLALEDIERHGGSVRETGYSMEDFKLALSDIKFIPRAAFYCDGEHLAFKKCAGRISTRMVTPYPPGIPILVPGQMITDEIIEALLTYKDLGVEIHGLSTNLLNVMTKEEEAHLTAVGPLFV